MSEPVNDREDPEQLRIGGNTRVLEIVLNPVGVCSSVKLDGEEVKNCRAVAFRSAVGEATIVSLDIINVAVLVSGGIVGDNVKVVEVTPLDADTHKYGLMRMAEDDPRREEFPDKPPEKAH